MPASNERPVKMLTVAQVATDLNISTKTVRRMIERDELRHHRIGSGEKPIIRVSAEDLRAYVNSARQ